MAKASINFQKAKSHSFNHNFRTDKPNYLLPEEFQKQNEFWQHEKSEKALFEDELFKAKRKGGRKPKFENSRWEAVLNLNSNHDLENVKEIARHIEQKFNVISTSIALHRDEGFLQDNKPQYNYHAHLNFMTYKDGRQNWRREHIKPKQLSELQTEVAQLLQMERGREGSQAKRLDHKQFKAQAQQNELINSLNEANKKLRAELQAQHATRADYAELEARHKKMLSQAREAILRLKTTNETLKGFNKALREENEILNDINGSTVEDEAEAQLIELLEDNPLEKVKKLIMTR